MPIAIVRYNIDKQSNRTFPNPYEVPHPPALSRNGKNMQNKAEKKSQKQLLKCPFLAVL